MDDLIYRFEKLANSPSHPPRELSPLKLSPNKLNLAKTLVSRAERTSIGWGNEIEINTIPGGKEEQIKTIMKQEAPRRPLTADEKKRR